MVPDQQRLSPEDRANLVAYLDNELNDAQSRAIATKLTQSLTARREVESLQKTWEMLDLLPRPRASQDFSTRTLAFAGQATARSGPAAADLIRRGGVLLAWVLATLALTLAGYLVTLRVLPNRSARLARDLPIAESLDEYREIGNLPFLQQIDSATEFN